MLLSMLCRRPEDEHPWVPQAGSMSKSLYYVLESVRVYYLTRSLHS